MPKLIKGLARRVSQEQRIWRVHTLKLAGGTDRQIAAVLAADPVAPVTVTHQQINLDWHRALEMLAETHKGQAEQMRMLVAARLERLLAAVWSDATKAEPRIGAVAEARSILNSLRELFGLDRELGDIERPLTIQGIVEVDYTGLSDTDLAALIVLWERQERAPLNGPNPTQ